MLKKHLPYLHVALRSQKKTVEEAASAFLGGGLVAVVIRCGALGAYALQEGGVDIWVDAYWNGEPQSLAAELLRGNRSSGHVVDVTGAGNTFLGGLSAGLRICHGDLKQAMYYGSVSASFVVEQLGLPRITGRNAEGEEMWNGDVPTRRLTVLKERHEALNRDSFTSHTNHD